MSGDRDEREAPPGAGQSNDAIHISYEETRNPRVDEMLARQKSMRGELGMAQRRKPPWYHRGWFVLGLVGAVGAVAVWAMIEPALDDTLYFQGTIAEIEARPAGYEIGEGEPDVPVLFATRGRVRIADQWIWITESTEVIANGRGDRQLELDELVTGRDIGFHLECVSVGPSIVPLAAYAVLDPKAMPGHDAATLEARVRRSEMLSLLLFGLVAAGIGLAIGCVEGLICRQPRRAALGGLVGLVVGFVGGNLASLIASLLYVPLNELAMLRYDAVTRSLSTAGLLIQTGGRGIAWMAAGMAMGLGQGIALRSSRLLSFGFLGGLIGGLVGGLLFDPIDMLLVGMHTPSAHWSRMLGLAVIGAGVGSMIGVVELLARDAWLGMLKGPLAGKEFLLFRDVMRLGASPRADVYLFNDDQVAPEHAVIRAIGGSYEIAPISPRHLVRVNERAISHARLRDGDIIGIGRTQFVFKRRQPA